MIIFERILQMIVKVITSLNELLWGDLFILEFSNGETRFGISLLVIILIPAGIYFTCKTRFLPFRLFPEMVRVTLEKKSSNEKGSISGLQALIIATATRSCGRHILWRGRSGFLDVAVGIDWLIQRLY